LYGTADFKRYKSDTVVGLDKSFFPVGKLMRSEFMLTAVVCLGLAAGSPALNVLLPKNALLLKFR
jgi:hypothetical protein